MTEKEVEERGWGIGEEPRQSGHMGDEARLTVPLIHFHIARLIPPFLSRQSASPSLVASEA